MRFEKRMEVIELLKSDTAFAVRSQIADALMEENDVVPGHLASMNAYRKIRSESQRNELLDDHPVISIQMMKKNSKFAADIGRVGLDPFYVFHSTRLQAKWYFAEFRRKRSIVSIDATGLELSSPNTAEKRHVFLYSVVAHGTKYVFFCL